MTRWIVRQTLDYSIEVEAENEMDAIDKAMGIDLADWDQSDCHVEAEEVETWRAHGSESAR